MAAKQARSTQYPRTHLLNPLREYVPAAKTDIRKTFETIRARQQLAGKHTNR